MTATVIILDDVPNSMWTQGNNKGFYNIKQQNTIDKICNIKENNTLIKINHVVVSYYFVLIKTYYSKAQREDN